MPPLSNRTLRILQLQEMVTKNRNYIKQINTKFYEKLNTIDDDNILRDRIIGEIKQKLDQLGNFVTEKLSNHPSDFENFVRGRSTQGGRRKTRRRKSRKKRKRKRKRKRKKLN